MLLYYFHQPMLCLILRHGIELIIKILQILGKFQQEKQLMAHFITFERKESAKCQRKKDVQYNGLLLAPRLNKLPILPIEHWRFPHIWKISEFYLNLNQRFQVNWSGKLERIWFATFPTLSMKTSCLFLVSVIFDVWYTDCQSTKPARYRIYPCLHENKSEEIFVAKIHPKHEKTQIWNSRSIAYSRISQYL